MYRYTISLGYLELPRKLSIVILEEGISNSAKQLFSGICSPHRARYREAAKPAKRECISLTTPTHGKATPIPCPSSDRSSPSRENPRLVTHLSLFLGGDGRLGLGSEDSIVMGSRMTQSRREFRGVRSFGGGGSGSSGILLEICLSGSSLS